MKYIMIFIIFFSSITFSGEKKPSKKKITPYIRLGEVSLTKELKGLKSFINDNFVDVIINSNKFNLWHKSSKIEKLTKEEFFTLNIKFKESSRKNKVTLELELINLKNTKDSRFIKNEIDQYDVLMMIRISLTELIYGKLLTQKKLGELKKYHYRRIHELNGTSQRVPSSIKID